MTATARRAVEAYGGEARWRAARTVTARVSAWGWAFRLKWRPAMRAVPARVAVWAPEVRLGPDARGRVTVLDGGRVRIEDLHGRVLAARDDPRERFPGGRRLLYWDALDQAYFAGYALWNYLTLPALLLREDIAWREIAEATLEARWPDRLPSHSAVQRYHFDRETGRLRQHDYTAEVFGAWARAAHVVVAHDHADGIPYTSRRRVTPRRRDGRPACGPLLVGLRFESFRLG